MNARSVKIRLERLEQIDRLNQASVFDQITNLAMAALTDEDLARLSDIFRRGAPLTARTPEESESANRYVAEYETAAMRIYGQSLTRILRDQSRSDRR
jgi:hypothetical protein